MGVRCRRCGGLFPEDAAHPGYPESHRCIGSAERQVMSTDEIVAKLVPTIARTIDAALLKHGPFTGDLLRGAAILTEEVGEVAKAALGITKRPTPYATEDELFTELMHVVAVAIMTVISFSGTPIIESTDTMPDPDVTKH